LLELTEEHARGLVGGPTTVQSGTLASNAAALALFDTRGYAPVRHFFRMVIELEREPPAPQWPPGLEPRAFDPLDAAAFHAAVEEAFADEFGHVPETFEAWRARRVEAPEATLDLWLAVWDGDEIAATLMCDRERFGMGWIGSVGVREPWRRRGLGLALLHHAFGEFWRLGQHRVALGVDAENPTGATRLYERAGMRVLFDYVLFEKRLA
jgi:ribosomal protein S18 acetylase RimI-like enzyme